MADLPINRRVTLPASELTEGFARAGGPGGQHVNKTDTKVELRWTPATSSALSDADRAWLLQRLAGRLTSDGELIVTCGLHRSQLRNRQAARERLRNVITDALARPKRRVPTKPKRSAVERRIRGKKQTARKKQQRNWRPDD